MELIKKIKKSIFFKDIANINNFLIFLFKFQVILQKTKLIIKYQQRHIIAETASFLIKLQNSKKINIHLNAVL